MNSSNLLAFVTLLYGIVTTLYIFGWVFKKENVQQAAHYIAWLGSGINLAGMILRWMESYKLGIGHAPLSNLYESMVFFAFVITIIYLVTERIYRNFTIGVFAGPLALLSIAYASLSPDIGNQIRPLLPALKSNWLIAHVVTCFIGYASFAVAFGMSIMYLVRGKADDRTFDTGGRLPDLSTIDALTHRLVLFGFLFLSLGIITGAVWANSSWGRYWGWDPKETWSLITWFIYATLLHARMMRGWHGKKIAWLSVAGFLAVMFTYFGVNLLPGLHSYGSS